MCNYVFYMMILWYMRYLQSVRSRWLGISQVSLRFLACMKGALWVARSQGRISRSYRACRVGYAFLVRSKVKDSRNEWGMKMNEIIVQSYRTRSINRPIGSKLFLHAWPKWAVRNGQAHTNINQNTGLASSYPFAEQDTFFCLLVYLKVLSESTSYNRPQVRSIKENTWGGTFRFYQWK